MLSFVLTFCLLSFQCTYTWEVVGHQEELSGAPALRYEYKVDQTRGPSLKDPTVEFQVSRLAVYQTTQREVLQEHREVEKWPATVATLTAISMITASLISQNQSNTEITRKNAKEIAEYSAAATGFFGIIALSLPATGYTDSKTSRVTGYGELKGASWRAADGMDVTISVGDKSLRKKTDLSGNFTVDLVQELGLDHFNKNERSVRMQISCVNTYQSFDLDASTWCIPKMKVIVDPLNIYDYWGSNKRVSRVVKKAYVLTLDDSHYDPIYGSYYWTNQYGGWIAASDVSTFYEPILAIDKRNPPSLKLETVSNTLFEESSIPNGVLDAGESAKVKIKLSNRSSGTAPRVSLEIAAFGKGNESVNTPKEIELGRIGGREDRYVDIPISADFDLPNGKLRLAIKAKENIGGYDSDNLNVSVDLKKESPVRLELANIYLQDFGFPYGSKNQMLELGEQAKIQIRIINKGTGPAKAVVATPFIETNASDIYIISGGEPASLGDMKPKEEREVEFQLTVTKNYSGGRTLPIGIELAESRGKGRYDRRIVPLGLKINEFTPTTDIVVFPSTESPDDTGKVDVDFKIPPSLTKNPNAIAIIIAVDNYLDPSVPKVQFAKRDAETVRAYLIKAFGYNPANIFPQKSNEIMTLGNIKDYIKQKLPTYLKPDGSSDVFIYYTGHGAPKVAEQEPFLVPYDCDPNFVNRDNAYDLKEFYSDISKLKARGKIVVVDACFSGIAGNGTSLLKNASPGLLVLNNPIFGDANTVIFQSSAATQVSNWYPEMKHSMFTYFFLKGLQGAADENNDRKITADELIRFINNANDGLPYYSERLFQRRQQAQLEGNGQTVIETLKK